MDQGAIQRLHQHMVSNEKLYPSKRRIAASFNLERTRWILGWCVCKRNNLSDLLAHGKSGELVGGLQQRSQSVHRENGVVSIYFLFGSPWSSVALFHRKKYFRPLISDACESPPNSNFSRLLFIFNNLLCPKKMGRGKWNCPRWKRKSPFRSFCFHLRAAKRHYNKRFRFF